MPKVWFTAALICALLIPAIARAQSQDSRKVTAMMIHSYDRLEKGKLAEVQQLYGKILQP
ncbi:MAG: hypothetical protein ACOZF2_16280 [Thermodesulfobacteriota bacterium]